MNTARMAELELKKRMLSQRSEVLRQTLAIQLDGVLAPAEGLAARAVGTGRWIRRQSPWLIAGVVALMVFKPKTLPNLAGRATWAWQTWLRWQPIVMPVLMPLLMHLRAAMASHSHGPHAGHEASAGPASESASAATAAPEHHPFGDQSPG